MANLEGSTFVLRTVDATNNNASYSSWTWSSVDLRSILGTLWDNYDYFNIALVSAVSSVVATTPTYATNDHKIGMINMSGLRWTSSYDTGTKTNTNVVSIGFINFTGLTTSVPISIQNNTLSYNTFTKGNPVVNITIFYTKILDGLANVTATNVFPQMNFLFRIVPIKKDEISFNAKRLF